jgi:hypothetical protein
MSDRLIAAWRQIADRQDGPPSLRIDRSALLGLVEAAERLRGERDEALALAHNPTIAPSVTIRCDGTTARVIRDALDLHQRIAMGQWRCIGDAAPNVTVYTTEDPLLAYLRVIESTEQVETLLRHLRQHHTHGPIVIGPGKYELRRQREYTPEGWRRVAD